jgi:hypothetical protein
MKFQISKEKRNPEYHINPDSRMEKVKKAAIPLLAGILAVTGISSSVSAAGPDVKTAGVPIYNPTIHSVTEMTVIVDKIILGNIGIKMKHDIPLKLKDSDGHMIEFIADGYNADKKLAYEWVAAPDYSKDKKDKDILTTNETVYIKDSMFGETMILVIEKNDKKGISQYVSTYMYIIKNHDKK